jgi:hypothetical protein
VFCYALIGINGQNLALNHLIATKQMNIIKLKKLLDISSYNSNNIFSVTKYFRNLFSK